MKVLKILGIVALVLVVLIGGCVALILGATRGLPKAADAFFSEVAAGRVAEAYASTAREFQAATSFEEFTAFLSQSTLDRYAKGQWSSRSIQNQQGTLEGTVTTRDGGVIPVTVELVKEGDTWKVLAFRKASAGLQPDGSSVVAPDDNELAALTRSAIALFADAVARDDFTGFHRGVGPTWQRQYTPEQLREAFAVFVEQQIDLRPLAQLQPQFHGAAEFDEDGVMTLEGFYEATPEVHFRLRFLKEQGRWQLLGFNLRL